MCIRQREPCRAVIENSRRPGCDGVARSALRRRGRESGCHVIGNGSANSLGLQVDRRVASIAIRGTERVVVAHMAGCARSRRRRHVRSDQGKSCRAVVPRCGCETHGRVAIGAICRGKCGARGGVRWGVGALPASAIVCVQVAARISAIGWGDV